MPGMRRDAHHHMTTTALTPEALIPLARAAVLWVAAEREEQKTAALADLGSPSDDAVVEAAIAGLDSADRNVRHAMVRVLSLYDGDDVAAAMLRASRDPMPRVRRAAAISMRRLLDRTEILDRLQEMGTDDAHPKVRREAFSSLAGRAAVPYLDRPASAVVAPPAARHLEALMEHDQRLRAQVLFGLVRLPLDGDVRRLLERFVIDGTKDEAVTATRALSGFRVRRVEEVPDPALAARIPHECERAGGNGWWWVPRAWDDGSPSQLAREQSS